MTDMLVTCGDDVWEMEAENIPRIGEEIAIPGWQNGEKGVIRLRVVGVEWNGVELPHGRFSLKPWVRCEPGLPRKPGG